MDMAGLPSLSQRLIIQTLMGASLALDALFTVIEFLAKFGTG